MVRRSIAVAAALGVCGCLELESASEPGTGGSAGAAAATSTVGGAGADGGASGGGAGGSGASGGSGFCATQTGVALCKDFDDGKPLGFGFTGVDLASPSTLELDPFSALSPPQAMKSTVLEGTPDADSYAYAYFDPPDQKAKLVTLSFDILVDITGIAQSADVATITVDPNGKRHSMAFELYAQGARIELAYPGPTGGTDYKEAGLTAFPIKDKWSRVSIHMNRTSPPSVSVSVDGASAGSMPLEPGFVNDGLRTRVGLSFAPGLKKGLSVRYDNVVVEVK